MNNDTSSVSLRKATTSEYVDINKSAHLMKKAMMPTVAEKEEVVMEVPSKMKSRAKKVRLVPEEPKEDIPKIGKVSDFVNQFLS